MRFAVCLVMFVLASCGRTVVYEPREPKNPLDAGNPDGGVKPCMTGTVPLSHTTPSIFFVIDRSGSMAFDLQGHTGQLGDPLQGPTRWSILADTMSQVLPTHDKDLAMGAVVFPTNNLCGFVAHVDVSPSIGNSSALLMLFDRPPGGGTPIAPAIESMASAAAAAKAKSIVLITDGEPNCNVDLDPKTCTCTQMPIGNPPICDPPEVCLDDVRSVAAVGALSNQGVVTHVVGFATTDTAATTLDQLAVAGGAPRMGTHKFYSAQNEAELSDVLTGISARETNCTWTALTALKADDVLEVSVAGQVVPEGSGWEWLERDKGSFVLRGTWCEQSLAGAPVSAVLTCQD